MVFFYQPKVYRFTSHDDLKQKAEEMDSYSFATVFNEVDDNAEALYIKFPTGIKRLKVLYVHLNK